MRNGLALAAILTAAAVLFGCGGTPAKQEGKGWKKLSQVGDGRIQIVEIHYAKTKSRKVYDEAVEAVCPNGTCVQVAFFTPADLYPTPQTSQQFFNAGGWTNYKPLAIWMGDDFTVWDCERAGAEEAPASALCGEGVKEAFDAVAHLATREGWVKGCGLPAFDGESLVKRYLATVTSEDRRAMLDAEFYQMRASSQDGPDDKANCKHLRERITSNGAKARKYLLNEIAKAK